MKKWTAVLLLMSLLSCLCLPASAEEEKVLDGCVLVTFGASNTGRGPRSMFAIFIESIFGAKVATFFQLS